MQFIILGDSASNFDGKFTAVFRDGEEQHELRYDLEDWVSIHESGRFGKAFFQIFTPKQYDFEFDKIYEYSLEEARDIYKGLYYKGWKK
jgi:hypothetical protein